MNGMSKAFLANAHPVLRRAYREEPRRRSRPRRYVEVKSAEELAKEKAARKTAKKNRKNKGKSQED